jgi:hypothetical protein
MARWRSSVINFYNKTPSAPYSDQILARLSVKIGQLGDAASGPWQSSVGNSYNKMLSAPCAFRKLLKIMMTTKMARVVLSFPLPQASGT